MNKLVSFLGFFLLKSTIVAQLALFDCNYLACFSNNSAMLNSCEEFNFYMRISSLGPVTFPVVVTTLDFGDGSMPYTLSTGIMPGTTIYPETTHSYSVPGIYVATLTVKGGDGTIPIDSCVSIATAVIEVTGGCEICDT